MGRSSKDYNKKLRISERLKSFRYGFNGIRTLIRYEHNARIHLFILLIVILAGVLFRISRSDWMAILFVTGLVFASECFNTAIEYISDQITDEKEDNIRKAKDVAAAGVLISAIISVVTGLIIFLPELINLFRR